MISPTPLASETISSIEEENGIIIYEKEDEHELQIEHNQLQPLKKKLESVLEELKLNGIIREKPIKIFIEKKKNAYYKF